MGVRSKPVADDFQATAMSLWSVTSLSISPHTHLVFAAFLTLHVVSNVDFCSEIAIGALKTPKIFWPRGAHDRI